MNQVARKTVKKSLLVVVGMFFFGFALVPIYDVFCDVTGLNGKTNARAFVPAAELVDTSRTVTVQFVATNNEGMPWEFRPEVFKMNVHPGEQVNTTFYARNPRAQSMVAQAVPSVSPGRAATYFLKTECFCFNRQELAAGEAMDMPLSFIVDRDVPANVNTITLSYTLFDVTGSEGEQQGNVPGLALR
ncbi:MAG: cytochrome c oxidase assembly protein [Gammaproteobacteria bacterium]|nr:cytochrome c oxidase assembly protein [Gammaproteobacteria bacterium]MBT8150216.1 cytochrome c oxidase assembly protein [Gammaproteobacteria bacterium]NND38850.1 cytochrome c oxidase assembly protein [Pseudomonadales bacterium]NNL11465.1 cytochrome c oxidase assembly protein [Pseudomonadales bacterium]RZV53100.1 MAG: cytochrome c oxidase assembly protein [Pseudomonadales bacterium]